MKKLFTILALSLICVLCAIGFAACESGGNTADTRNPKIVSVYNTYVAYAEENGETPLSYEEWLKSIKGKDGKDGTNGIDGINGNDGVSIVKIQKTFTDGLIDTYTLTYSDGNKTTFTITNGQNGEKGDTGERGEKGEKGEKGSDGKNGDNGITPQLQINENTSEWEVSYDNGATWASLGVKAKGDKGAEIKKAEINDNGELIITLTDDSTVNAGVVKIVHPHEIVEKEIIDKEPTCHSAGISYIICDTCKEILRTVAIEKTPHPFADEIVAPTCTESGYTTHTCTVCGYKTTDSFVEPTGHSYKREYMFDDVCHWQETICGHADAIEKELHELDENDICTVCGYDAKVTLSLKYVEINNGTEYAVDKIDNDQVKVVYIPETYNGKPVTKINNMAFYEKTSLEKVIISNNVIDIGENVFYNCYNLKMVKLPENLIDIKAGMFYRCGLTSITIPNKIISIGAKAFYGNNFKDLTIPDSVTSIGNSAFSWCGTLRSIMFGENSKLESIGENAFYYTGLTSIAIPDSVKQIGFRAFYSCKCVTSYNNLYYVDNWLVDYDFSIEIIRATLKEGTVGIATLAFYTCSTLKDIVVPRSIKHISSGALSVTGLMNIYYAGTISEWVQIDGLSNLMSSGRTLYINNEKVTDVILENITEIKPYAFSYCSSLTSVIIPDSVTSIGVRAFDGCSLLTNINFNGTKQQWSEIEKGTSWENGVPSTCVVHCADGTEIPIKEA